MSNYIGVRCPVCSKKFNSGDDVVVCPVCGAPHHRGCYKEKGECVFAAEHLSGKEWQAPVEAASAEQEAQHVSTCRECGASNPGEMLYCQVCGRRLGAECTGQGEATGHYQPNSGNQVFTKWAFPGYDIHFDAETFVYGGLKPEDKIDGQQVRDLAVYVGQNSAYYLPRFKSFSESGAKLSVNFSALLVGNLYFFYRKMYGLGMLLLAISVATVFCQFLYIRELMPELIHDPLFAPLVSMLGGIPAAWGGEVNVLLANRYEFIYNIVRVVNFALRLGMAIFANYLYYRKAVSSVKAIRERMGDTTEPANYNSALAYSGGVNSLGAMVGLSAYVAGYFVCCYLVVFNGIL